MQEAPPPAVTPTLWAAKPATPAPLLWRNAGFSAPQSLATPAWIHMIPNQTRIAVQPMALTFERVRYCNTGGVLISEGLLRSAAGLFIELAPLGSVPMISCSTGSSLPGTEARNRADGPWSHCSTGAVNVE
jgi:hypothetical protein